MQKLCKLVSQAKFINISLRHKEETFSGFIHDLSNQLFVMQDFKDFTYNGFFVLRVKDVKDVHTKKRDQFFQKVLIEEKLIKHYNKIIPIQGMKASLQYFAEKREPMIICYHAGKRQDNLEYFFGEPTKINNNDIYFRHFNAVGEWFNKEAKLNISNIISINIDSPYIMSYLKYMSNKRL